MERNHASASSELERIKRNYMDIDFDTNPWSPALEKKNPYVDAQSHENLLSAVLRAIKKTEGMIELSRTKETARVQVEDCRAKLAAANEVLSTKTSRRNAIREHISHFDDLAKGFEEHISEMDDEWFRAWRAELKSRINDICSLPGGDAATAVKIDQAKRDVVLAKKKLQGDTERLPRERSVTLKKIEGLNKRVVSLKERYEAAHLNWQSEHAADETNSDFHAHEDDLELREAKHLLDEEEQRLRDLKIQAQILLKKIEKISSSQEEVRRYVSCRLCRRF